MRLPALIVGFLVALWSAGPGVAQLQPESVPPDPAPRWWKGNLHTHSFWSDGNDFPEMIGEWYRTNGYNFLAISDHNVMSRGQRWMELAEVDRRSRGLAMARYLARFGPRWVERRINPGTGMEEVRLQPMDEYRALLEERGQFLLFPAEEITSSFERLPVHINATNLGDRIAPLSGESVQDIIRRTMQAVEAHGSEHGRVVLTHLNHPNFQYGVNAEDFARVVEDRFFEVFDAPLPALGVPGFFGGVLFSVVLGVAGRRRRFDQLSLPRFAAWGALGGVLLALLPAALVAVGLATLGSPEVTVWQLTVPIIAPLALLSSASAAAALTLARRAERRELAAGDAAVAALDATDTDHRLR